MLWRVVSMAALPGAIPSVLLVNELRKLREQQQVGVSGATPAPTNFVCDAEGNVSSPYVLATAAILDTSFQGQVLQTVVATAVTVSDAASNAADAAAQAASKAAAATLDAASRAAASTREAVATLGRQIGNTDRIAALRSEAEVLAGFQGSREWRDLMRALFAVGIAMAAADGEITDAERRDIHEFVGGAAHAALPVGLKAEVEGWLATPPTIEQAYELASRCGDEAFALIEDVMEVVMQSDSVVHPAEAAFQQQWGEMRQAVAA